MHSVRNFEIFHFELLRLVLTLVSTKDFNGFPFHFET